MLPAASHELQALETRYANGDRSAMTRGLLLCAIHDSPLPPWLARAWVQALDAMQDYQARSWDDLLPCPLPTGAHLKARRRRLQLVPKVKALGQKLKEEGQPVDDALFERIADELDIKPATARRLFYFQNSGNF